MNNTPSFNIAECARHAYFKTWEERHYLAKMAIIPLLVKFLCYAVSASYIEQNNILHLSFMMLPSYIVEGWFLAHWARTVILDHRWPFRPSGDEKKDMDIIQKRARGVMAGMVGFALINFLIAGYFAYFFSLLPAELDPNNADPRVAIVGVVMIISTIMLFRFVWGYIALALNIPFKSFLKAIQSGMLNFPMIGMWIVCFVPAYAAMQVTGMLFQGMQGDSEVAVFQGMEMFSRAAFDMIKNLLTTAAFAYAIMELLKWQKKN